MIKKIIPLAALLLSGSAIAQIGIGTEYPASSAQLDIVSSNKGVLLPRIELKASDDRSSIKGNLVESLLVYHTGNTNLVAGFYYWKEDRWSQLVSTDTYIDRKNNTFTIGVNPTKNGEESLIITDTENHRVYLSVAAIANNSTFIENLGDNIEFKQIINDNSIVSTLNLSDSSVNSDEVIAGFTFNNGKSLNSIQFAETLTAMAKGTDLNGLIEYYFIDETGNRDNVIIQVTQDIITDFEKIINDTTVNNLLKQFISTATGDVSVVRNATGDVVISTSTHTFNLSEEIRNKETNTTLTSVVSGVYVYKNEETIKNNGTGITINVVSDVQNNFQEIINKKEVQEILNQYITGQVEDNVTYKNGKFYVTVKNSNGYETIEITFEELVLDTGKTLTTDGVIGISTNGGTVSNSLEKSVLKPMTLSLAKDMVTTAHIKNRTLLPEDLASTDPRKVLVTDSQGEAYWMDRNEITTDIRVTNGLNKENNQIQLGGVLTKATDITVSEVNYLAIKNLTKGSGTIEDQVVVMDSNGVLKQVNTAMPRYFYMPSTSIPTHDELTGIPLSGVVQVNLYEIYKEQYGFTNATNQVSSNPSSTLPIYLANRLDYFITYYDKEVFTNVSISSSGVLQYTIDPTSYATSKTYMNIVLKVKE